MACCPEGGWEVISVNPRSRYPEDLDGKRPRMGEVARAALASVVRKLKTVKVGHRITDSAFAA